MNEHDERDARLAELLSDAVSDVEPSNALDALRTRTKVVPMNSRRPWLFAAGGAVLATAAVITAIAFAGGSLTGADNTDVNPGPAEQSSETTEPSPTEPEPTDSETPSEPSGGETVAVPVYFAGEIPDGLALYREFQTTETADPVAYAADATVSGTPVDPDYRTLWPSGSAVGSVDATADLITVDITGAPHDLPSGMTEEQARLAIQQVIYSVQAAYGQGRVPVQLMLDGGRSDQVLGQPTSEPLANDSVLATLAHVSLTTPSEGEVVSGDMLEVSGVANSFEANVVVRLQRWEGTEVIFNEPLTATGYMDDKLFPFEGSFDISDVPPGDYLLTAMTDDPSGGAEGGGSHTDSKRITVE